jgi:hypothetical protein
MPSFPKLYKKQRKAIPFDLYIYFKAKKQSKDVVFYLIGVHPDYQNKAVTAVIFSEYYHTFKAVENCFRTPELADNTVESANENYVTKYHLQL